MTVIVDVIIVLDVRSCNSLTLRYLSRWWRCQISKYFLLANRMDAGGNKEKDAKVNNIQNQCVREVLLYENSTT